MNKVNLTEDEWRKRLTPEQFGILRKEGTERAFTSPLHAEKTKGTYKCAGCGTPLFTSDMKLDSGTGWQSFGQKINLQLGAIAEYEFRLHAIKQYKEVPS